MGASSFGVSPKTVRIRVPKPPAKISTLANDSFEVYVENLHVNLSDRVFRRTSLHHINLCRVRLSIQELTPTKSKFIYSCVFS